MLIRTLLRSLEWWYEAEWKPWTHDMGPVAVHHSWENIQTPHQGAALPGPCLSPLPPLESHSLNSRHMGCVWSVESAHLGVFAYSVYSSWNALPSVFPCLN